MCGMGLWGIVPEAEGELADLSIFSSARKSSSNRRRSPSKEVCAFWRRERAGSADVTGDFWEKSERGETHLQLPNALFQCVAHNTNTVLVDKIHQIFGLFI